MSVIIIDSHFLNFFENIIIIFIQLFTNYEAAVLMIYFMVVNSDNALTSK